MLKILIKVLLILGLLSLSACSDSRSNKKQENEVISKINTDNSNDKYSKPSYDYRLDNYEYGKVWYDTSDIDSESSYNIGVLYHKKIKDLKLAEFWYLKSWNHQSDKDTAYNLGQMNRINFNNISNAITWYKKAAKFQDTDAIFFIGLLYQTKLDDYTNAIIWYKKAIEIENLKAMKNLARLYHLELKDDIQAVEYFLPLIKNRYTKEKVLNYLRNNWKLSEETIKKGYEAQLKSKIIPEKLKYKGGL